MSLDLSINSGKSSSYSRLVPPEARRYLHFPSEGPFLLHPMLRVTSCSQDILKMSLISNWWETKPPAKKQQFTAARFYFQDSSTRPSKTSRLPSNRTRSSPTKSSAQLQQVLFFLCSLATHSLQQRTHWDNLFVLVPHLRNYGKLSKQRLKLNLHSCRACRTGTHSVVGLWTYMPASSKKSNTLVTTSLSISTQGN